MKVEWFREEREGHDSYGYRAQSLHTREAAAAHGLVEEKGAPVMVRVCSPQRFHRFDDRPHVLYSNVEAALWPEQAEAANRADCIVTISEFCAERFREACRPDLPVYVAPLGIDRAHVPVLRRAPEPGQPFRWLWVGAPSPRKGWDLLTGDLKPSARAGVWHRHGWADRQDVELYMKWSLHSGGKVQRAGNVTYDSRRLSREQMADLYASAHGFILPSYGEGQGLTLAEAMASGLPCVYTPGTGMEPWADGWPVEFDLVDGRKRWPQRFGGTAMVPQARLESIDQQMRAVMADYEAAAPRAHEIGRRVYETLTWDETGRRFVEALRTWRGSDDAPPPRDPETVGVYFANGMGNWLMTTPAIQAIRQTHPTARLDIVLGVDESRRSDWATIESLLRCYEGRLFDRLVIRDQRQPIPRDEYGVTLAHTHGHASMLRDSMRRGLRAPAPQWKREHEVSALMDLARALGYTGPVPDMVPPIEATWDGAASDYVVISDGAERNAKAQRKRWSAEAWRRFAASVRGWYGLRVVQIGGPDEWAGGHDIEDRTGCTVEESARLLAGARAAVTVDTFAMHLACSLGVPLVTLFGPTLESKNGPWTRAPYRVVRSGIPCSPCWGGAGWTSCQAPACMSLIEPGAVFRALRKVIDGRPVAQEVAA